MLAWLKKFVPERKPASPTEATAHALSQALRGKCPRCNSDLHNHAFQIFAMTVASAERNEAMLDFIRMARNHEWESLSIFQDFDPLKNSLEAHAFRCEDGRLNLLFVRNPFELLDGLSLEDWEALDENESRKWLAYLDAAKWMCFATAASPRG